MGATVLAKPIYEMLLALGVLASGLVIAQIAKVDPALAEKLSELLRVGPEVDIDLTQLDFWKVQEAARFVRENPLQPSEVMSFAREFSPKAWGSTGQFVPTPGMLAWDDRIGRYVPYPGYAGAPSIDGERIADLLADVGKRSPGEDNGDVCEWLCEILGLLRDKWRGAGGWERRVIEGLGRTAGEQAERFGCGCGPGSPVGASLPGDPARRVFGRPCDCC